MKKKVFGALLVSVVVLFFVIAGTKLVETTNSFLFSLGSFPLFVVISIGINMIEYKQ